MAKDIQLLRRAGPYQLALLSHLRKDDQILPVMKAVWLHTLHSSCPGDVEFCGYEVQKTHWRPVAESLLKDVLGTNQLPSEFMFSQHFPSEVQSFQMPGSAAVMQIMLPQVQHISGVSHGDFLEALLERAGWLAEVLQRCLPASLCLCLEAVGLAAESGALGLFGEDVITEIATRACASMLEWPGKTVFHSVRSHLQTLVLTVISHLLRGSRDVHPCARALLPAVAGVLLLPMSQSMVGLEVKFSRGHALYWDFAQLESALQSGPMTMQKVQECGIKVVLQIHAAELEGSLLHVVQGNEQDQTGVLVEGCVVQELREQHTPSLLIVYLVVLQLAGSSPFEKHITRSGQSATSESAVCGYRRLYHLRRNGGP